MHTKLPIRQVSSTAVCVFAALAGITLTSRSWAAPGLAASRASLHDTHEQAAPAVAATPSADDAGTKARSVATSLAVEGWLALRASTGTSLRNHHSMDLYTTDNTLRARGAGLGVDVWRPRARLALAVEGDWAYEKASSAGVLGGQFNSWYTQHQGNLGVSLRYNLGGLHPLLALVSPHVRLFGSVAATKQRLRDSALATDYDSHYQATGGAGIALGFSVRSPSVLPIRNSTLGATSVGFRFEAGYGLMGDPEFRLQPVDKTKHPIDVHAASLGGLQLDAAFLRASLELRI